MPDSHYFTGLTTPEEIRERYRRLAAELHPDHGGNPEAFLSMKAEYESLLRHRMEQTHTLHDKAAYIKFFRLFSQFLMEQSDVRNYLRLARDNSELLDLSLSLSGVKPATRRVMRDLLDAFFCQ